MEESLSDRLRSQLHDKLSLIYTRDELLEIIEKIEELEEDAWKYRDMRDS